MTGLNAISGRRDFRRSSLWRSFRETPLGFIDIGAAGGAHPLVLPVAELIHCTCFEPDANSYRLLKKAYAEDNPFARITIHQTAVGAGAGRAKLYLTRSAVNSSLLKPRAELLTRYGKSGFRIRRVVPVKTESLDTILSESGRAAGRPGEVMKLDCQGAEYLILKGAARTLRSCMALQCEVMLFPMYERQKIFSEIDLFLRGKKYQLYGLYPNYISAKKMDRTGGDTEERIVWADAVYFRDPFADGRGAKKWLRRDIEVLLVSALLFHFYDFALEIIDGCGRTFVGERNLLKEMVLSLAEEKKAALEADAAAFGMRLREAPPSPYLAARKFIDGHRSNSSLDFIKPEEIRKIPTKDNP